MTRATRCASGLLVLLGLVLPFELELFRLGPIGITTVELVMYALLAAFGLHVMLGGSFVSRLRSLLADPLARASVLWAAVVFLCAFMAPSDRAASFKFALRTLCGVLVFFAARSLGRELPVARSALFALLASALLSAATALAESWFPPIAHLLATLREGAFGAFALRRASGVFAYPTIGAVYWEAALPLVVVAPFVCGDEERGTGRTHPRVAIVATAWLFAAILASGTRSGLAGGAIACAALMLLTRRWHGRLARTAAGSLGAFAVVGVLTVMFAGGGSPLRQRLAWWHDDDWFRVTYEGAMTARRVSPGDVITTPLRLHNTGALTWHREGAQRTYLGHHWYRQGKGPGSAPLATPGEPQADLPSDVSSAGAVDVVGVARAPEADGRYRLAWDLVQEHVTWFSQHGNAMPEEQIVVGDAALEDDAAPADAAPAGGPQPPSRSVLWRGAVTLFRAHPLFGIGPDNFRRRYGEVIPPDQAGAPYSDARIHANSLYFETLADLGILGLVALAALGLAWLVTLRRCVARRQVAGLGFAVGAGVFLVHGVTDYFLEFTPTYGLFWMLLGLADGSLAADRGARRGSRP